jgi:SNF2 family DNA or RNA helicase
MIFVELPYVQADVEQGVARIYRRGQEKDVNIYYFYFKAGIDKRIINILKQKKKIMDMFR